MRFDIGQNYVYANLSRYLTGNFALTGELRINDYPIFTSDPSNSATGIYSFALGGVGNDISGDYNAAINSFNNDIYGSGNAAFNANSSTFETGSKDNTLLAGRSVTFLGGITGSTAIKDNSVGSLNVTKNNSLYVSFGSGIHFEDGDFFLSDGSLYVDSANSGLFSGDLHSLGTIYENGVPVATTGDLGVTSGVLNTKILNTGLYAVGASGLLATSISNTGSTLNVRLDSAVFNTGTQTISGAKTVHEDLTLSQSVYIKGNSGILSGISGRTQIVPANSGDTAGSRGLIAYSGQFLYYKISDNPHIWTRHSGTMNW